jgi:hypothetical protein
VLISNVAIGDWIFKVFLLPNPTDKDGDVSCIKPYRPILAKWPQSNLPCVQTRSMKNGVLLLGWILCGHANVFQEVNGNIPDYQAVRRDPQRPAPSPPLTATRRKLQSIAEARPPGRLVTPTPSPSPVTTATPSSPAIDILEIPTTPRPDGQFVSGPQPRPRPCPSSTNCPSSQNFMHLFCVREACVPNDRVVAKKRVGWECGQCF